MPNTLSPCQQKWNRYKIYIYTWSIVAESADIDMQFHVKIFLAIVKMKNINFIRIVHRQPFRFNSRTHLKVKITENVIKLMISKYVSRAKSAIRLYVFLLLHSSHLLYNIYYVLHLQTTIDLRLFFIFCVRFASKLIIKWVEFFFFFYFCTQTTQW